jgi:hypothetical protein
MLYQKSEARIKVALGFKKRPCVGNLGKFGWEDDF